jgi:predicted ferric reductase
MSPARPQSDAHPDLSDTTGTLLLAGGAVGLVVGFGAARLWASGLAGAFAGEAPTAYWTLARATGVTAYALVWLAVVLGLAMTSRAARLWPGGPLAFDMHGHAAFLGLGFALLHPLALLGDRYIGYTVWQLAVPFAGGQYRPFWVGLGQVAFYLLLPVVASFYARRRLGPRAWRAVHGLAFLLFALVLGHAVFAGTDAGAVWARGLYWGTGASALFLTVYRFLVTAGARRGR